MSDSFFYRLGAIFPTTPEGNPNIVLSSSLSYDPQTGIIENNNQPRQDLEIDLDISSNPVQITNVDQFVNDFLLGANGLTAVNSPNSLFTQYKNAIVRNWTGKSRNNSIYNLRLIGYTGPGFDQGANTDEFWSAQGQTTDELYTAIQDNDNYDPVGKWSTYNNDEIVRSIFDAQNLLDNLDVAQGETPPLWLPNFLYTYGLPNGDTVTTSYPGPTLIMQPGEDLRINFDNEITIPGLTTEQIQAATLVRNSSYGNGGSAGLGGTTSTNFHFHGAHTAPGGFGDNVVSRYTTGQSWTTNIDIPDDHGIGSYWYHPHYHPSVNAQVYGGQSGFIQIGDPLSRIPSLEDIPRNLAILKNIDLDFGADETEGEEDPSLRLTSYDGLGGIVNRLTMVTVNGEFQPNRETVGGWQSISLSNQSNQAYYNVSLQQRVTDNDGNTTLEPIPLFIYGEDGHQYPEIRRAEGVLGSYTPQGASAPTDYTKGEDIISLAPGKRVDVLFYLESGTTELTSVYSFEKDGLTYNVTNMGGYPELSSENSQAAGPLAILTVPEGTENLSPAQQEDFINQINTTIPVQDILPTTTPEEYDPNKVPSVNLFDEQWQTTRGREFNWTKDVLVGRDPTERDAATQEALKAYQESTGQEYQTFTALPRDEEGTWLGYENPFLINDHVFPFGPLVTAQLGTIEEWTLKNWSINAPTKYIGHPFHIHINDYQVLDSDTELPEKRNLEDVTMLNSSGYHYYDASSGEVLQKDPLQGTFTTLPEAIDPNNTLPLATWGANNQTIRMLFQDFLGTYVFHCHILPHEDAGMMMAIQVIENTDDSWLIPAEHFNFDRTDDNNINVTVYRASDFKSYTLSLDGNLDVTPRRGQTGDVSSDFVQEVVITTEGDGLVRVYDGASLLTNQTNLLSSFKPYENSNLAPWAVISDLSGDNRNDITTAGFTQVNNDGSVNLTDFTVTGWNTDSQGEDWTEIFEFDPWEFIDIEGDNLDPVAGLRPEQVTMSTGDYNLDNFADLAIAYRTTNGVHLSILDGAAIALLLQTGQFEGGYQPDQALLADALIENETLAQASEITLTSGFNQYAQIALENLILTANSPTETGVYTFQLGAGHFIATSDGSTIGHGGHGSHGGHSEHNNHNMDMGTEDIVTNLNPSIFNLVDLSTLNVPEAEGLGHSVTPIFGGALGNGGLLVQSFDLTSGLAPENQDPKILFATGNEVNGTPSSGSNLLDNTQQLNLNIETIGQVGVFDLEGIGDNNIPDNTMDRYNLTRLLYQAYFGRLSDPTGSANWSAKMPDFDNVDDFVDSFISSPESQAEIVNHFGASLEDSSVETIVNVTSETLYSRNPSSQEIQRWNQAVDDGLSKSQLPLAILQSTVTDYTSFQPENNTIPITDPNPNIDLVDTQNNSSEIEYTISGSIFREAAFNNTVGFYRVLDENGTVIDSDGNTYSPNNPEYQTIALSEFNRLTDTNANLSLADLETVPFSFNLSGDELFAPFMAVNGSAEEFENVFFAYKNANVDNFDHVTNLGYNTWGFEDILGGGDLDYDDAIIRFNVDDRTRVSFLASSAEWSDAQWANNANLFGSFGQGLSSSSDRFQAFNQQVAGVGYIGNMNEAQTFLDQFIENSLGLLNGSEVSNSGFF
ncbi:multicopper oxidase domain-containing protein [Cyanobacterium aponinum AL20118]|uniref:Multicopper oxidase domain-containing protein n=1 Tax=Cyanobacterium aponinum AL20115 TaxID=3090662 RepID=A0AAF0ZJD7_9CHRO|nr:multicopper oxidase domain-containing protein [Cyanobacterium aponinum]WPF89327.1 multicopper oxidase domain-containing protein [Cyanobacterium aponinum AL20115]